MSAVWTLLKYGGVVVVLGPAYPGRHSELDKNWAHYLRYTRELLEARFREAGFVVEKSQYFDCVWAVGWHVSGRLLKRPHIAKAATQGYRMASSLRGSKRPVVSGSVCRRLRLGVEA